ncbi:MAG TPA: CmcJ/NvfI family oxidoreductase [Steroidobacteraceae bacterium]|jgi:hypothetical protein|nr:CmcJ/NvfI family oxidoreductase [Steroidobacteraceae bacterium]
MQAPGVISAVNYLQHMEELPVFYSERHQDNNLKLSSHQIHVTNARRVHPEPSVDGLGFVLTKHTSAVTDFTDAISVDRVYRGELAELIRGITAAPLVIVTPRGVVRWSERHGNTSRFVNSRPGRFVHVDYSRKSFTEFAQRHVADIPDAQRWLHGRYAAFNIWRVFSAPPQDVPLAVCDATSVRPEDVTTGMAVIDAPDAPEFRFESSLFHFSPRHRWYYFPDMTAGEALIFKAFDSDLSRIQGCPHSAFNDPTCPAGAAPRASIEIRAYAFWG